MSLHHRARLLVGVCLAAALSLLAPAASEPTDTGATTPPPPIVDPIIVGVTAVERPDQTQSDATRNIRIYTFLYNNSTVPQVIDWRTRRLHSPKVSASISENEDYGLFNLAPGEVVLMKSLFYYQTGFPGKFTFSVRDRDQNVYAVPAMPMATNAGLFGNLPVALQQRLIQTFLAAQSKQFKWWYRDY